MAQNILLSKIVANPTDTTWSQAYSTLNLYIVLSIRSESTESGIVTSGKELLEKIQREYFSLDEKSIVNISVISFLFTSNICVETVDIPFFQHLYFVYRQHLFPLVHPYLKL